MDAISGRRTVPPDDEHRRIAAEVGATWTGSYYKSRTSALTAPIRGLYASPGDVDCVMLPIEHGAFEVFCHGDAAPLWQERDGVLSCFYNKHATLHDACMHFGAEEDSDKGEYIFHSTADAVAAARACGQEIELPPQAEGRAIRLGSFWCNREKVHRLIVRISRVKSDGDIPNWVSAYLQWHHSFGPIALRDKPDDFDDILRCVVQESGGRSYYRTKCADGKWRDAMKSDAVSFLTYHGVRNEDMERVLGRAFNNAWNIVNLPFQGEFPGNRRWNRGAAQLAFVPAPGEHPTWDLVMRHLGRDLDRYIEQLAWCQEDGLRCGGDYLNAWLACMIRKPFLPTPYLFFFGPQNGGKSLFHEAASMLMTRGAVRADRALTNQNDFNGELANAVLCIVEEKNIARARGAYDKIKEWVTAERLSIRELYSDSYMAPNSTHWCQCANYRRNLPIFPGDTRITVIKVDLPAKDIPKPELKARLESEAPHYLHTLMTITLPKMRGRLALPVIETDEKRSAAAPLLEERIAHFMEQRIVRTPGKHLPLADVKAAFDYECSDKTFGETLNTLGFPRKVRGTTRRMHVLDVAWAI